MDIWPFGKKEKSGNSPTKGQGRSSPVGRVESLSSQGLSEPEIIRTLKNEGYSPIEVDSALRSVLKDAVGSGSETPGPRDMPQPAPGKGGDYPRNPVPEEDDFRRPGPTEPDKFEDEPPVPPPFAAEDMARGPVDMPRLPGEKSPGSAPDDEDDYEPPAPPTFVRQAPPPAREEEHEDEEEIIKPLLGGRDRTEVKEGKRRAVEELIESIVDEKWNEVRSELGQMENRFRQIDSKLIELDQTVTQMRSEKKSDIDEIETKIDSYKQSMSEVSARMESVERAMKDSLTPMLQSLRSLSDTIKTMKSGK
jgi:hypothetical protein